MSKTFNVCVTYLSPPTSRLALAVIALSTALTVGVAERSSADSGLTAYQCESSSVVAYKWAFSLDFNNHAVLTEAPVNWVWFTPQFVMFGHSVLVKGGHYSTQSYALDRATGVFEACDYASAAELPTPCDHAFCAARE